jgi:hypothetical protein
MVVKVMVGFWMLARMVFHALPGNDPMDPGSEMSPMHPDNVRLRLALGEALGGPERVRVEWFDVWPVVVCVEVSVLSTVVVLLLRG